MKKFKQGDRVTRGREAGLVQDFLPASGRYLVRVDHKFFENSQDNGMRDWDPANMERETK